jgi:hypothetical protein
VSNSIIAYNFIEKKLKKYFSKNDTLVIYFEIFCPEKIFFNSIVPPFMHGTVEPQEADNGVVFHRVGSVMNGILDF